jgi:rhodanese-related sulfurtransferase
MMRALSVAVAAMSLVLAACGGETTEPAEAATVAVGDAVIIDVRTPEEFAAGHLDGAVLIDIKNPSFDAEIAKLDPAASYIIYCRSGNRSAQAADRMREIGITNLTDLGSLENASAQTGVAIVQG